MRDLRLVGVSADGRSVVLVDDTGTEFATPADDRLRAALRGDRARLGQLEIEMDSVLRPRDIQARIRAGSSPEDVAVQAQVPVDKIMAYCVPVLAERQHIAELARRSHVRRRGTEGPSRGLADVVAERLNARSIDPGSVEWDAWRRQDGRWAVQASYHSGERARQALFSFDAVGRYSLADDDEAKWLTGEQQSTSKGPQPREGGRVGERRLSSVPADDGLLGLAADEGDEYAALGDAADDSDDLEAVVRAVREPHDIPAEDEPPAESDPAGVAESPAEAPTASVDPIEDDDRGLGVAEIGESAGGAAASAPTEPTPERRRRSKRASVPSWDEIMFGGGGGKDDA